MQQRPNVVVIMADQMKATASHLYGSRFCRTPALERLASEGVLFEHAYTPHPLCMPARVSTWSGQYPHSHGSRRNETPMRPGTQHAFRVWSEAGFECALIGKNHCFAAPADMELFDTWCEISHEGLYPERPARGMEWFRPEAAVEAAHRVRREMPRQAPALSYAVTDFPLEDYSTGLVAGQAVRYLEQRGREALSVDQRGDRGVEQQGRDASSVDRRGERSVDRRGDRSVDRHGEQRGGQPFALWVSFPDPHTPFEAPRCYFDEIMASGVEIPAAEALDMPGAPERNLVLRRMLDVSSEEPADVEAVVAAYHAMVRFLDDGVAQILAALERTGLRENTIVVFCSDHGDFAGEHGMTRKGGAFYDCMVRVPLIVSWPGSVPQGQVDSSMVNLIDLVPTLLTLQELPVPSAMQGAPLPTVTGAAPRDAAFSEYGAGGPPFTLRDLEALPVPAGLEALKASLQWREAEGRRKMVRTAEWKYVTDPLGDSDELYHLTEDPLEHRNLAADPLHADTICRMRSRLLEWAVLTEDAEPVPLPGDGPTERSKRAT